jgi:hypothetical protein
LLEHGRGGSPELLRKVADLLEISDDPPSGGTETFDEWTGPPSTSPPGVTVTGWRRPEQSGDTSWTTALGREAFVVGAIDVAGHGRAPFPKATYMRGVVDGALHDLDSAPRIDVLGERFTAALRRASVDVAWFLAVLRITRSPGGGRGVLYEAVSDGYPPPLLLLGPPFKSVPSAAADPADGVAVQSVVLTEPFRLVAASDGLLRRLGAGDEASGRRSLLAWQSGTLRDRPPREHLGTSATPSDDESLLIVSYVGWDHEYKINVGDKDAKRRVKRDIGERVRVVLGESGKERAQRVVAEAMSNAHEHAYAGDGPLAVRLQLSTDAARIEVADEGRGGEIVPGPGMRLMHKNAKHVDVRRNFPSGVALTFVT